MKEAEIQSLQNKIKQRNCIQKKLKKKKKSQEKAKVITFGGSAHHDHGDHLLLRALHIRNSQLASRSLQYRIVSKNLKVFSVMWSGLLPLLEVKEFGFLFLLWSQNSVRMLKEKDVVTLVGVTNCLSGFSVDGDGVLFCHAR